MHADPKPSTKNYNKSHVLFPVLRFMQFVRESYHPQQYSLVLHAITIKLKNLSTGLSSYELYDHINGPHLEVLLTLFTAWGLSIFRDRPQPTGVGRARPDANQSPNIAAWEHAVKAAKNTADKACEAHVAQFESRGCGDQGDGPSGGQTSGAIIPRKISNLPA